MTDNVVDLHVPVSDFRTIASYLPPDGTLTRYCRWVCRTTRTPAVFHVGSILAAWAYVANKRGITYGEPDAKRKRFSIVSALIGGSGTGKSTAATAAQDFLSDWNARRGGLYGDPFVSLFGTVPGIVEEVSTRFDARIDATTCILTSHEMSQILAHEDFHETFCQLYDGRTLRRTQRRIQEAAKTGDPTVRSRIHNPAICGILCSTPAGLERVVRPEHVEGGLFSRVVWVRGRFEKRADIVGWGAPPGYRQLREEALSCWDSWATHVDVLQQRGYGLHITLPTHLSARAYECLQEAYWQEIRGELRVAAILARLHEYVNAFACLYALANGGLEVQQHDVDRALDWARQVEGSARDLTGSLAVSQLTRDAQRVEHVLQMHPAGLRKRDLYQQVRMSKYELDAALDQLIDAERALVEVCRPDGGGRPAVIFQPHDPD